MKKGFKCKRCGKCCEKWNVYKEFVFEKCPELIYDNGIAVCKIYDKRFKICRDYPTWKCWNELRKEKKNG